MKFTFVPGTAWCDGWHWMGWRFAKLLEDGCSKCVKCTPNLPPILFGVKTSHKICKTDILIDDGFGNKNVLSNVAKFEGEPTGM